jgi:hypothetical protein
VTLDDAKKGLLGKLDRRLDMRALKFMERQELALQRDYVKVCCPFSALWASNSSLVIPGLK